MKYRYLYAYRNKRGQYIERKSFATYDTRGECDRMLSNKLSDLDESGFSDVQGDIIEVEE